MSHTEDLVKEASEASIKILENNYQKSQEVNFKRNWIQEAGTFLNTHVFHKVGLHVAQLNIINNLVKDIINPMGRWTCSGSFESFLYNPKDWDAVYGMLSDDYSKSTFDWFVKYRTAVTLTSLSLATKLYPFEPLKEINSSPIIKKHILGNNFAIGSMKTKGINATWLVDTFDYNQYSYQDKVKVSEGNIVIDAGAYRGDTALYFSSKIGHDGIVYAFEPDGKNYAILNENVSLNHLVNIQSVKAGLGFKTARAKQFGADSGINLRISENTENAKDDITIYSIDNFILEKRIPKVDFIKMDIEGWELEALKGAENCLKSYKPKLAICVYHRPEDLLDIANYLKLLAPEYHLYLDHKSTEWTETVLYATI